MSLAVVKGRMSQREIEQVSLMCEGAFQTVIGCMSRFSLGVDLQVPYKEKLQFIEKVAHFIVSKNQEDETGKVSLNFRIGNQVLNFNFNFIKGQLQLNSTKRLAL
ncbi:MAG: hypothetical protein SNF33_06430 [Candidatus Algichlamydia australiensis]|nr:hypothetical protein [Chlamydiales bacterium]